MADITWTVETNAGTVTQSLTLSAANMVRFTDWVWVAYPQLNPDGTAKLKNNANVAQAIRDWMTGQANGTKANVLSNERNEAAQIARDGVSGI